jgi:hypothetical protein
MMAREIVGIAAVACGSICGLVSALTNLGMMDKVNGKLPKEEQFAATGWYWFKTRRLHREYQRLYPGERLLFRYRILTAIMFACVVVWLWGFGFFAR